EKLLQESEAKKKLESLNSQLETEKSNLEEELQNERSLVIDKEEILKQTRQRELDLEDEVKELNNELEEIVGKCEQLSQSKKILESKMQDRGLLDVQAQLLTQQEVKNNQKEIIQLEHSN
ncbi:24553_t:CDS:1, partial [Racocetra persica]